MRNKRNILAGALVAAGALGATSAFAGGSLDTADITAGNVTVAGFVDGLVIPIEWDQRCIPIRFTLDTTPPNFNTAAPDIDLATTRSQLQQSFNQWNKITTSFIEMNIVATEDLRGGVLTPPGVIGGFDFINEINFVTQGGFLAAAPSVSLIQDTTLVAGQDIDADGDSDVFTPGGPGNPNRCRDADGDGDIEFPAGAYEAGTILENDIGFSATVGIPWNITPDNLQTTDIQAVAVHEFGHSHGLSHSLINQFNGVNGEGATMYPFIDINDPGTEQSQRTPAADDIAWSSFLYQEGSGSGVAALQSGDRRFTWDFGLLRGTVTSGTQGGPIAGANIWIQEQVSEKVIVSGYSGTTQLLVQVGPSGITDFDAGFFVGPDAEFSVLNGDYVIPVPAGHWNVGLQSLDGQPAATGNISLNAIIGGIFGDLNFQEEFYNGAQESANETRPGDRTRVITREGQTTANINFVTNVTNTLRFTDGNFDANDPFGFTGAPAGRYYAVRFNNAQAQAFLAGPSLLTTALFLTDVADASAPVIFESAMLTTGTLNMDGTAGINLASPLAVESEFVAQDTDFAPMYFRNPQNLTNGARNVLSLNPGTDLFLVLRVPAAPFPGVSNLPPLIGLDNNTAGNSYLSDDGGVTFNPQAGFNYFFELVARP